MFVDAGGLNLSNTELRSYLVLKQGFLDFHCYSSNCSFCRLRDEDDNCLMGTLKDDFDTMFRAVVL